MFHHAGIDGDDRVAIEKAYLEGNINVICCTSTLAVGVNLPCHMVIIKNTLTYEQNATKEYSDLEVMQMLGRAGRPQFDTSATAVIITTKNKAKRYEEMMSGQEVLESRFHLNLIEHLVSGPTIYAQYKCANDDRMLKLASELSKIESPRGGGSGERSSMFD